VGRLISRRLNICLWWTSPRSPIHSCQWCQHCSCGCTYWCEQENFCGHCCHYV
jgi:hypothetical protein